MKVGELLKRLGGLDPEMELNDLRACVATSQDDIEALRDLIDDDTGTWEEYGAKLTSRAVVPLLLELRDLMLMPASQKGWLKPAEMAKKVAEEAEAARARYEEEFAAARAKCEEETAAAKAECEEQLSATRAECEEQIAAARTDFEAKASKMAEEHMARAERERSEHRAEIDQINSEHRSELHRLESAHADRVDEFERRVRESHEAAEHTTHMLEEERQAVPVRQAEAVGEALAEAAEKSDALARARLSGVSRKKGLFRSRDLDSAMLRSEADGFALAAQRLRKMSDEAKEHGRWPVEFSAGEEADAPDVVPDTVTEPEGEYDDEYETETRIVEET